ncbi:MAG: M3 family metallopeptidase [Elusimicrobia bacterium]|nr:M3 family metallopeptidase [Elusimicrobiota bacterium]
MLSTRALLVAALLGLAAPPPAGAAAAAAKARPAAANPLLSESSLPYRMPPFDRIKDEHFQPAYEQAMAEHLKQVEAIAADPNPPTFENTLVALERSGRMLARVDELLSNLVNADANPVRKKIELEKAPKLAAHRDAIRLNAALFARIQALYDRRGRLGLDPESAWLLERYYQDFVRAGARLSDADKTKLKAMNAELASLGVAFSQNALNEVNASTVIVADRAELAGLSPAELAAAESAAKAEKLDGKFLLRLNNTSGQPLLAVLENRGLRARILRASLARGSRGGPFDNRAIVLRVVRLRAERAALLGFSSHAAYVLDNETARSVGAVNKLLAQLAAPAAANARREAADMQALIDQEPAPFPLAAWDWAYYAEKVRSRLYAFDASQLRPYFELDRVLQDGVFYAANRLYGITFKERHDLPTYHPDVRVFEVFDADGSPLGLFLGDFYARPTKKGGAWMNEYMSQSALLGTKPVIGNHLNIQKPSAGEPALLTVDEVKTMFHEFGHALHGLFSNVRYPRFGGTNVPHDFVEYPSQVNEMWQNWPEVLAHYARHHRTGEPIPSALLEKVLAAQKFNQGFITTEYLAAAVLDQAWHQLKPRETPEDALAFEAAALRGAGLDFAPVPPRYRSAYFLHPFSWEYDAAYYAYIWSEVLDADSVEWFKTHGGLTRENGDRFRAALLSRGGSAEPMSLFRAFAGRDPDIKPLLARRGLDQAAPKP